jgi:pimeloyl-ACP methyl ester carboxylesterase
MQFVSGPPCPADGPPRFTVTLTVQMASLAALFGRRMERKELSLSGLPHAGVNTTLVWWQFKEIARAAAKTAGPTGSEAGSLDDKQRAAEPAHVQAGLFDAESSPAGDRAPVPGAGKRVVLLIHGLGCEGRDATRAGFDHEEAMRLTRYGTVVAPDLLGHGESSSPEGSEWYTMTSQADALLQLLLYLRPTEVCVVGHSMGGPIALAVAERWPSVAAKAFRDSDGVHGVSSSVVKCIAYSEPNIDSNDCFGSRRGTQPGVDLSTLSVRAAAHTASCRDLVKVSDSGELLPRMENLRTGARMVPSCVFIGESNRGKTTSEESLLFVGFPVEWIKRAGHCQHVDNPLDFFTSLSAFIERSLGMPP